MKIFKLLGIAFVCFIVLIIIVVAIGFSGNKNGEGIPEKDIEVKLEIGDIGIVNNNSDKNDISGVAILAVDEKALDDFTKALVAGDKLGYSQMLGEGRLFAVDNGTAIKVIDTRLFKKEVRILEGEHLGKSGWIAYEFVVSK